MIQLALFAHQVFVLTVAELRELLFRRRSLLSLLLYVLVILLSVGLLFRMHGTLGGEGAIDLNAPDNAEFGQALERMGARGAFEMFLRLARLPSTMWIFQLFSIIWFPTLVALVSCDCIALDKYRGTLRFILSRTSRTAYFMGKLFSHLSLYLVLQFLSLATVIAYSATVMSDFDLREYLKLAIQYFLVFVPFLFCVVSGTQLVSSISRRPMNALIRVHVFWVLFIFILAIDQRLSPLNGDLLIGLFAPFENYPLVSAVGYAMWGFAFTLVGLVTFARRDV